MIDPEICLFAWLCYSFSIFCWLFLVILFGSLLTLFLFICRSFECIRGILFMIIFLIFVYDHDDHQSRHFSLIKIQCIINCCLYDSILEKHRQCQCPQTSSLNNFFGWIPKNSWQGWAICFFLEWYTNSIGIALTVELKPGLICDKNYQYNF